MEWFISDPRKWACLHFGTSRLGDVRRTRRLVRFAANMAGDPAASIPCICEDWADTKAVYQLFARPAVTFEAVCQPHFDLRHQAQGQRLLILNDTTELGFGRRRQAKGLGPLGNARIGACCCTLACSSTPTARSCSAWLAPCCKRACRPQERDPQRFAATPA